MKENIADILKQALKLPPEARAALAGSLLDSVDVPLDLDAESAWEAEIAARIREIDKGKVTLIPWAEARARIAGYGYRGIGEPEKINLQFQLANEVVE